MQITISHSVRRWCIMSNGATGAAAGGAAAAAAIANAIKVSGAMVSCAMATQEWYRAHHSSKNLDSCLHCKK